MVIQDILLSIASIGMASRGKVAVEREASFRRSGQKEDADNVEFDL